VPGVSGVDHTTPVSEVVGREKVSLTFGRSIAHSLLDRQRKRLKMASRFYAASGVAYTTPAAFFAPSRREPEQLHPALRQKAPSTRQKSTRDGSGLQPERRRTRTSGNKSTSSKATRLRSEDEAAPLSQRGGPSVVMSECCEQKPASKDAPSGTAKSTRIRRARSEPRQPHNNVSSKDGHPGGLARFVGEIRLGCALLRLWSRRRMDRSLERRGCRSRWP